MRRTALAAFALVGLLTASAPAQTIDVLVTNLKNPSGVAIQPGTGVVFISDSGNHRVLRYIPGAPRDDRISVVINGFPNDVYGKGPMYDIGPLGLGFVKESLLVVGGGGNPDGSELLRFYEVPAKGKIKADKMKYKIGPLGPSEQTEKGEGNFYGIAITPTAIFVTCNGDDTKGWVSKVEIKDSEPGKFEPFIDTKVATEVDAPVAVTIGPDGKLVVGQMGEMNKPKDSLLTVYDPASGKLELSAEPGLFDIAGLAYSPKSGKLYAVDFAWMETGQGGLYRLDVKKDGDETTVEAVKIVELDKPSALAFDKDGACYVTEFGTAAEGDKKGPGRLVRISGDL